MHVRRSRMRGLSLVELMVGVVVGLFIVAAAALLVSNNLAENRRLLLETQLQQDLRATADIVTRELRRIGYVSDTLVTTVPSPSGSAISTNSMTLTSTTGTASSTVYYNYYRTSGTQSFGFRLDADGVIRSCQSGDSVVSGSCGPGWQDLTDPNTVQVTRFEVTALRSGTRARAQNADALVLPCPNLCLDGTNTCWPSTRVQEYEITITGQARSDSTVIRTLKSSVRARNDRVQLSAEAPAGQACPG